MKGQTAMEYLMTYGWAILIVIVVVAALYSMGVFSIKGGVACSPCFSYFAFRDYDSTNGVMYLRNGARSVSIGTVTGGSLAATSCGSDCTAANKCDPGDEIVIDNIATTGDVEITIPYTDCDTNVDHSDSGTIHNK